MQLESGFKINFLKTSKSHSGTGPTPAVEVIRIPPIFLVCAVHEMSAIFSGCVTSFAVVVAFVADWSLPTVAHALEVTSVVDEVIDLRQPCCRVIWADQVFSFPLVAVPIFPAVVWVWEIPISKLTAVRNSSTVNGCGCGWRWWLGSTHSRVSARSRTAVNIFSVGAPAENLVKNPWKSVSRDWFALPVRNCSLLAVIVERAGLGKMA